VEHKAFSEFISGCLMTGSYGTYGGLESDWRQGYGAGEIIALWHSTNIGLVLFS